MVPLSATALLPALALLASPLWPTLSVAGPHPGDMAPSSGNLELMLYMHVRHACRLATFAAICGTAAHSARLVAVLVASFHRVLRASAAFGHTTAALFGTGARVVHNRYRARYQWTGTGPGPPVPVPVYRYI